MKDITSIENYLQNKINGWYKEVVRDYGISGKFTKCEVVENDLIIFWEEEKEKKQMQVAYFAEYTKEQLYDIWMEGWKIKKQYNKTRSFKQLQN